MAADTRSVRPVRRVAVIGTGTVGASWCAWFLAQGLEVSAWDLSSEAPAFARDFVERAWPVLEALGLAEGASCGRLRFHAQLGDALAGADFVQESGPEQIAAKQALFADMEPHLDDRVLIASSSSGLPMSEIQALCREPGRCLIGHPFNPPHLLPLVEVVAGRRTEPWAVDAAMAFYAGMGKRPIRIAREVPGHVANRLQAALWREAASLAREGVASVTDIDAAVAYGPGLRWALMGPHLTLHLGGGRGGLQHFLDHLGDAFQSWWDDLGTPRLDEALRAQLVAAVQAEAAGACVEELVAERDRLLLELVQLVRRKQVLP